MKILEEIVAHKRREVEEAKRLHPFSEVLARARQAPPPRGFAWALRRGDRVALIAEVKRASPSKGPIKPDLDPAALAAAYASGGADALSVLTERKWFLGSWEDLHAARAAVKLPVLRKDFIVDPWQVWETRAEGADALLLIVRALEDPRFRELLQASREAGLAALVEVHDEAEMLRAVDAGAEVIGINNRNLDTFVTDLATTERLAPLAPRGTTLVGESGISSRADVERLCRAGVHAVLVGEELVKSPDAAEAVRRLLA